ncbi:MAG TPA: PKD domain-containing protein [Gemmatimonadaceae bacterium]|nr:PKD domain-containing protein [Gemmatimonadaceae bacterium]
MIAALTLAGWRRSSRARPAALRSAQLTASLASVALLAACGDRGALEPSSRAPTPTAPAAVVVTPDHSTYDTRAEFNAATSVDHLATFEELTGDVFYIQTTPWTSNGATYTSDLNIVLGPGVGLGVSSNSISTEFGTPLTAQLSDDDAFTAFAADVTVIGDKVPVGIVITTNLGSYAFTNVDVPLATTGHRFFGIALSKAGEHLTGFRFTVQGLATTVLLDNVAVGHVAVVHNADPSASVGGPYTGKEGTAVSLTLGAMDPDSDPLTYSWDFGDGTVGSGSAPPASHNYADNGSYDIMLAVADGRGGVDTARTTATIANVAPVVASFSVPGGASAIGTTAVVVPVSTTFTDAGALDTHTATLECGIGDPQQLPAPNGAVSGKCSFALPGVYRVRITVRDDDGGTDTEVGGGKVVIYDPRSWVTGGGWVSSPAGAVSTSSLSGRLSFSLAVRYESAASVPSGSVDAKMSNGNLEFHGTSFEWLAIAGSRFELQGRGTMNGSGDYGFSVAGEDGPIDSIRIRVWSRSTGAMMYDNQVAAQAWPLAPLGGGSLQVHQR